MHTGLMREMKVSTKRRMRRMKRRAWRECTFMIWAVSSAKPHLRVCKKYNWRNQRMRGMKISAFGEYGDALNLSRSLRILEQKENSFISFLCILVGTDRTKNNIMLLSRESREKKTKCDRIAPPHPLSWPCVSDLLYLKARAGYALKPSMTRLHNEELVN